ncbi:MAG TPA: phosphate/phosphite/phosphonate ABC transporter substrate-binding protein [Mucilaginibacter sp.]|jgi:phosphonate transport system substrate-binding protein|nr:phosphate/phosphite/phosphonate ABC transporter substrate-binding protein [Mucilaginibacter sp.]
MKALIRVLIFLLAVTAAGCKDKAALNDKGVPGELVIGIFGGENPGRTQNIMESLRQTMEKSLGMPVKMIITNDYTAVIEGLHAKKIHMGYLGPFSYILAAQYKDINPLVVIGRNGQPSVYHSNIYVRTSSGLNNMTDVKAHAKDLTFCFTDPASTSGHLVPRSYLNSIGLDPDKAFKQTVFAGSHAAAVLTVAAGKVDVGCATDLYGIDFLVKKGLVKPGVLKVLWTSAPIVESPVVIRKDINKDLAEKIKQYYLSMAKTQPKAFHDYIAAYYASAPADFTWVPIADSDFNGIRKMAAGLKDLKLVH